VSSTQTLALLAPLSPFLPLFTNVCGHSLFGTHPLPPSPCSHNPPLTHASDVTTLTCYPIPVFIGLSILTLLPTFPHLYVFLPLLLATAAALVYLLDRKLIFLPIQTLAILQAVTLFVVVAVFICCYLTLSLYDGMTGILSIGKYLQTQSTTSPYLTAAYDANVDKLKGAACEFYNGVREEQWWGIVEGVGGGMFEGSGEDCVFKLL